MNKNNIGRRDMIRMSSMAALSAMVSPLLVSAKATATPFKKEHVEIPAADGELCFMNALDMAALVRTKKYLHVN